MAPHLKNGNSRSPGEMGIPRDTYAGRRQLELQMERRRTQESRPSDWNAVRQGWFFGRSPIQKELLAQMHDGFGAHHRGAEREESCEARAERLLESELLRLGWKREQLVSRRKADAAKVRLARQLRQETTMTLARIAEKLAMGSVAQSLRRNC